MKLRKEFKLKVYIVLKYTNIFNKKCPHFIFKIMWLWSPKRVMKASLFFGTVQTTKTFREISIVGSHFLCSVTWMIKIFQRLLWIINCLLPSYNKSTVTSTTPGWPLIEKNEIPWLFPVFQLIFPWFFFGRKTFITVTQAAQYILGISKGYSLFRTLSLSLGISQGYPWDIPFRISQEHS